MSTNLKLGDRLAIVKDGVKKGLTPQEAIQQYLINKDGGYPAWKNSFKKTTGVDPDLDNTYNYELFFKENPEAAKQLVQGLISPEVLLMYKTPEAILKELLVQRLKQGKSLNDLMDYSLFEKIINNYMNKSISPSMLSLGGPINLYLDGTEDLERINEKRIDLTEAGTRLSLWGTTQSPDYMDLSPEEIALLKSIIIDLPENARLERTNENVPEEYRNLPKTKFISVPYSFLKERFPLLQGLNEDESLTYYLQDFDDKDIDGNPKKEYRIRKVKLYTPVGKAWKYWKDDLKKGKSVNHTWLYKDDKYLPEGPLDIGNSLLLDNVEVIGRLNAPTTEETDKPIVERPNSVAVLNMAQQTPTGTGNSNYLLGMTGRDGLYNGSLEGEPNGTLQSPTRYIYWDKNIPYDDFQFSPYEWLQDPLYYLLPPGYVPIPNWNVALIYDNEEGMDFTDFMRRLAGYGHRDDTRDMLMAELFKPKDYFADPYAGEHYTDTRNFYDVYNNNPYNKILRENNGIPLY